MSSKLRKTLSTIIKHKRNIPRKEESPQFWIKNKSNLTENSTQFSTMGHSKNRQINSQLHKIAKTDRRNRSKASVLSVDLKKLLFASKKKLSSGQISQDLLQERRRIEEMRYKTRTMREEINMLSRKYNLKAEGLRQTPMRINLRND